MNKCIMVFDKGTSSSRGVLVNHAVQVVAMAQYKSGPYCTGGAGVIAYQTRDILELMKAET